MTGSTPSPPLSTPLVAMGRTVRLIRSEIETATGATFARPSLGSVPVLWGDAPWARRLVRPTARSPVRVSSGPLLSPYDSPQSGLASLHITYAGHPFGGTQLDPAVAELLRTRRLFGWNRHPASSSAALDAAFAAVGTPVLALVDPSFALSRKRVQGFVKHVRAARPNDAILVAGSRGCAGFNGDGDPRLAVIGESVDPWLLFERCRLVCVARWRDGCEARLAGAGVISLHPAEMGTAPEAQELLRRRYGDGIYYFDPWTRGRIGMGEAIERVAWLRDRFVSNRRRVVLVGISQWKRPAIDVFADGPHGPPIHTMTAEDAVSAALVHEARIHAWATRMPESLPDRCQDAGIELSRIEDGFLRSVGLGASLKLGASIVVDDSGIYYDPRTESRLTRILKLTTFDAALTGRARALREDIVARRLSKYNVGLSERLSDWPCGRRIVLVPGQVEDDASVQYGSPRVRTNLDLLREARARNPDAFLLYKPHPDVEAGFRPGAIPDEVALGLADRLVGGLSIVDLLDRVHHVETMTSLTGFEAMIRRLSVATHGRPFYSGWGLSEDLASNADRGRRLTLDELVAGALILYPLYFDPVAMKPCEPEQLLERLSAARQAEAPSRLALGTLQHLTMRARYALINPILRRLRARRGVKGGAGDAPG